MTMRAALEYLRGDRPERIVVALPVAPPSTVEDLKREADDVVVLETPEPFYAVGQWYMLFDQTGDEEVRMLLNSHSPKTQRGT
jgi:putative phosphoribosyl transferase